MAGILPWQFNKLRAKRGLESARDTSHNDWLALLKLTVRGEYDCPSDFWVVALWIEHLNKYNVTKANSAHSMEPPPPTTARQSSSSSSNQA